MNFPLDRPDDSVTTFRVYVTSTFPVRRGVLQVKKDQTFREVKDATAKALSLDLSDYKYSFTFFSGDVQPLDNYNDKDKLEFLKPESHLVAIAPGSKVKTSVKEKKLKEKLRLALLKFEEARKELEEKKKRVSQTMYIWDTTAGRVSRNLQVSSDQKTVSPVPHGSGGTNFGICFMTHVFTTGKYQWRVRINGDPRWIYTGVAYCHSNGINPMSHDTVNNNERGQSCFFYEFDGDVRGPEGERHYGPAIRDGDVIEVIVDADIGEVSFTINGATVGESPAFRFPGPTRYPLTPFVSIGNERGSATIMD